MRVLEKGKPGLFPELATAAARWRPRSRSGRRGEGRRAPERVGVGPGVCGGAACGGGQQEVASRPSLGGGGATQSYFDQRLKSYFENIGRILDLMDFCLFQCKFNLISN